MTKFEGILQRIIMSDYSPPEGGVFTKFPNVTSHRHRVNSKAGSGVDVHFQYFTTKKGASAIFIPTSRIIEQQINES